jgi:hypothetical protein
VVAPPGGYPDDATYRQAFNTRSFRIEHLPFSGGSRSRGSGRQPPISMGHGSSSVALVVSWVLRIDFVLRDNGKAKIEYRCECRDKLVAVSLGPSLSILRQT